MDAPAIETAKQILAEAGAPVIMFDHVQLAFDDKVVLKDVSFTLINGHTKIILGASGSGKSTALKIITGLLRADAGVVWVNGQRVDQLTEQEMMAVRADLGMIFQEGALFDSLTVRENVGYKLYEETDMPLERGRPARRGSARVHRPERAHRQDAVGAVGRPAAPGRDRPGDGVQAAHPALRRGDDRPRSDHGDHGRRRDHQAARPRRGQLDRGHPPAARRVLCRRRTWRFAAATAKVQIVPATPEKEREAEFIMLRDGLIVFEGDADALRSSKDPYIQEFLS